jgi:hypothetical protein
MIASLIILLKSKQVGGLLEALGQLGRGHQAVRELYEAYAERLAERKSDLESAIEAQRDSMRSVPIMSDIMSELGPGKGSQS